MTQMAAAPSVSLGWLARHELRVALRDSRGTPLLRAIIIALVLLVPTVIGVALAWGVRDVPDMPRAVFGYVSAASVAMVLLLLSGAGVYVLRRFHDRSDLDLLLSAPVPPTRVFAAKALAVYVSVGLPMLVFVGPFLIASALLGHPGWLGGIVMVMVAAVMASSLAFITSSWLLRLVGARRGRTIIQVASGAFAALIAVAGQTVNFAPKFFYGVTGRFATPPSPPFDWPARAVFGEPLPLAIMVLLGLASALLAARVAVNDLGQPQQFAPVAARARRPPRFAGGQFRMLLTKELRLLGRDPELVAVIALQMAYMIPAFGLIFAGGLVSPARLAAAAVLFDGLLTSSLAWLTICGEDAPELIAAAPVPDDVVVRAKLAAACLPALVLVVPAVAAIAAMDLRAGVLALLLCPVAAVTAGVQQFWAGKPQLRRTFRFRQKGSMLLALSEYAMAGCWSAAASLAVWGSPWALLAALGAMVVLALSWVVRVRGEAQPERAPAARRRLISSGPSGSG
jgi:ABC-2 type transport system permease protein